MIVNLTIPVFNEEHCLKSSVEHIRRFCRQSCPFDVELVIANNGSTDGTLDVAQTLASMYTDVSVLHIPEKGRGRALKTAWSKSTADYVSYMDVDLSTDLSFFPLLLEAVTSKGFDIAVGSRLLCPGGVQRGFKRKMISRVYNLIVRVAFGRVVSDMQCGFKAMKKGVVSRVVPQVSNCHWFFDTELLIRSSYAGFRLCEIPVSWRDDPTSHVRICRTIVQNLLCIAALRISLRRSSHSPP